MLQSGGPVRTSNVPSAPRSIVKMRIPCDGHDESALTIVPIETVSGASSPSTSPDIVATSHMADAAYVPSPAADP